MATTKTKTKVTATPSEKDQGSKRKASAAAGRKPAAAAPRRPGAQAGDAGLAQGDPQQRAAMVAEAAYYRAQTRDFAPGGELEDWLHAEAEIDRHLQVD